MCVLGGVGAMERAFPKIGHLRHRWRNFCLDPIWGSVVCGAGQRPWSSGDGCFFFFLNNSSIKWTFLLQFKDRFYFIGAHCPTSMRAKMWFTAGQVSCVLFSVLCRWVTSPGPTTAPRLSSRTVTALSWWGQSVARDTGPPRSTWKVRSPVVSGRLMTSR